jgi:predicted nucleic acid-binding protein
LSVVVDASVIVAALVETGPDGQWAEETLARGSLHAPHLVAAEVTHVLHCLERNHLIASRDANAARNELLLLNIDLLPFAPFADRIWELRYGISSYDAWYVAVAEALEMPLATLDARLAKSPLPLCLCMTP